MCGAEASSNSSVMRSPIERERLPWPCVWAFTRPGCSRRRDASMIRASSGTGMPEAPIAAMLPFRTRMSAGPRKPVASSTNPPRIAIVWQGFSVTADQNLDGCGAEAGGGVEALRAVGKYGDYRDFSDQFHVVAWLRKAG